jgi:hypothetical protein
MLDVCEPPSARLGCQLWLSIDCNATSCSTSYPLSHHCLFKLSTAYTAEVLHTDATLTTCHTSCWSAPVAAYLEGALNVLQHPP